MKTLLTQKPTSTRAMKMKMLVATTSLSRSIMRTSSSAPEKKWLQSMHRFCDEHHDPLIDCGLKEDKEECFWEDSDYEIDDDIGDDEHSPQDTEDGIEQEAVVKKAPGSEQQVLPRPTYE